MKKAHVSAIVIVSLALLTALPAEAGGRRYNNYGGNNGGMNGWAAAAIGAIVGVGVGAALAQQQPSANYYVQPAPVYQNNPNVYYFPQQACQTAQVPVYNQYGQIVQYRQVCAN
jgi:hypothetical protein